MAVLLAVLLMVVIGSAYGDPKTCVIGRYGNLVSFSGEQMNVEAPCKYRMANFKCGQFLVSVTPGSALDGNDNNRFTPEFVWVKVVNTANGNKKWEGSTSADLLQKRVNGEITNSEVWKKFDGDFNVFTGYVGGSNPAAKLAKTSYGKTYFEIFFREPSTSGDDAGITVSCLDDADFTDSQAYPQSLCGDGTNTQSVSQRQAVLFPGGDGTLSNTVLFDILNNDVIFQSKYCETMASLFQNDCGDDASKAAAVETCGSIFDKRPLAKCLVNDGAIEDDFRKCLIDQCSNSACNQLKSTIEDSSNNCPADTLTNSDYLSGLSCA